MKKNIFTVALILLFLSNCLLFAQDQSADEVKLNGNKVIIDVKTAINLALANNLNLKTERLKYDNSKWNMYTSWNVFLPNVSMSASLLKSNLNKDDRTTTIYDFSSFPPTTSEYTVPEWALTANFNLNLNLNAAMGFQVYQTVLDWQSGKTSLEIARKKLIRDVQKNLYSLVLLKNNVEILKDSIGIAKKRYDQAVINYKNGLKSEYDMLTAQVDYENLKPQLVGLQNSYDNALLAFKQMIGIRKGVEIQLDAVIENPAKKEFNADELIKDYIDNNLDIISLNHTIKSLVNARNITIALLTPSVTIGYSMDPTFKNDPLEKDWFGNSSYMEDNWKQRNGAFIFTLSLPIEAMFPFSREQSNIIKSAYTLQETKIGLENLRQGIELQIESTVLTLEKSVDSIESLKLNKQLAKKAWDKAEEAYRQGTIEYLSVQNAENGYRQAEYNLLNEEYNYLTGVLDLEYTINTTLTE